MPISSGQVIAPAKTGRRAVAVAALLMLALSIAQPWADANASPERVSKRQDMRMYNDGVRRLCD